jgi:hypothetical protein
MIPGNILYTTFKIYPFSIGAFVFSLTAWILVTIAHFNIKLNPPPESYRDYRGEGLIFGVIFAILVAIILVVTTVLNLIFQKAKTFYARLVAITIIVNLLWYGTLMI